MIFNVSIVFTLIVILSCIDFVVEKIEKSNLNTEASRSVLFPQMRWKKKNNNIKQSNIIIID